MPVVARSFDPPTKARLVHDRDGLIAGAWQVFFTAVARRLEKRLVVDSDVTDAAIGSIAAGSYAQIAVSVPGIRTRDFCFGAALAPPNANLIVSGQITADNTVTVTIRNISGGAINPPAGSLSILLEQR